MPDAVAERWVARGIAEAIEHLGDPAAPGAIPVRAIIPEGFPAFKSLRAAGFRYLDQLADLTSEDLVSVPGVGPALARRILEAR